MTPDTLTSTLYPLIASDSQRGSEVELEALFRIPSSHIFQLPLHSPPHFITPATATNMPRPQTSPCIMVPLYIYPTPKAWNPIFEAAQSHPNILFIAIVNPANGPGPDPLPDACYSAMLSQLGQLPNLRIIGYVHCSYGERSAEVVEQDIGRYLGWNSRFRVDGIFFDEAPWSPEHIGYMRHLSQSTRSTWQKGIHRSSLVVYNPGVVVAREYYEEADYVVVFEQSERHWNDYFLHQGLTQISAEHRSKAVAMVHTCLGQETPEHLAKQIHSLGFGGLHLTNQVDGGYTEWPENWGRITDVVGRFREPGSANSGV